jgi:hypothetical protein
VIGDRPIVTFEDGASPRWRCVMARKKPPADSGRSDPAKKKGSPRTEAAGQDKDKLADLPDLITHRDVAEKLGITTNNLRDWVAKGTFPVPHSRVEKTWLYRLDLVRAYIETGRWPPEAKFRFSRGYDGPEGMS